MTDNAPPGWYPIAPGWQQYWDGRRWIGTPVGSIVTGPPTSGPLAGSPATGGGRRARAPMSWWRHLRAVLGHLVRGQTVEALRLADDAPVLTGRTHGFWALMVGLDAALVGVLLGSLVARARTGAGVPWGPMLGGVALAIVLVVASGLLRIVAVRWTLSRRGVRVSFARAGNVLGAALTVYLPVLVVAVVASWLPHTVGGPLLAVDGLVAVVSLAVAEIVVYRGVRWAAGPATGTFPVHAVATLGWLLLCSPLIVAVVVSLSVLTTPLPDVSPPAGV